jgi:septal ring factor EnvC (AmiA/AmiB activator)
MVPLLAILSIMACLVAKMFLALQTKAFEKKLGRERDVFHEARKELGKAAGKMKLLNAESKQLETKRKRMKDHISRTSKSLNTYAEEENKARAKAKGQEDLMKEANERF